MMGGKRFAVCSSGFRGRRALQTTACSVRRAGGDAEGGRGTTPSSGGAACADAPLGRLVPACRYAASLADVGSTRLSGRRMTPALFARLSCRAGTPRLLVRARVRWRPCVASRCGGTGTARATPWPHGQRRMRSRVLGPSESGALDLPGCCGVASRRSFGSQEEPSPRRGGVRRLQLAAPGESSIWSSCLTSGSCRSGSSWTTLAVRPGKAQRREGFAG